MVVWQPSTDKMWEFWQMHQESDGWHAEWGGEMDNVSTNPGYFTHDGQTTNWGATATGLPLLGGLVTAADLKRGYIDHALAISIVEAEKQYWSWPAQRTDGNNWTPGITPIPEGTRFRLDPTLNIAALNLPRIDRMLAAGRPDIRDGRPRPSRLGQLLRTGPGEHAEQPVAPSTRQRLPRHLPHLAPLEPTPSAEVRSVMLLAPLRLTAR